MTNIKTYIINSIDKFHLYFPILNEDASIYDKTGNIKVVGFDVEYIKKTSNKKIHWIENNNVNNSIACVIQICTNTICFIVHLPFLLKLPQNLIKIIKNYNWLKMGVNVEMDLKILSDNYNLGHCGGGIDIGCFAICAGIKTPNLEFLYKKIDPDCDYIKKKITSSATDWSTELTDKKIKYAAYDAIMSYRLGASFIYNIIKYMDNVKINKKFKKINIVIQNNYNNINNILPTNNNICDNKNYISILNEYCQQKYDSHKLKYTYINIGNTHLPMFKVLCQYNDVMLYAIGHSKKEAKKEVAKKMYESLL